LGPPSPVVAVVARVQPWPEDVPLVYLEAPLVMVVTPPWSPPTAAARVRPPLSPAVMSPSCLVLAATPRQSLAASSSLCSVGLLVEAPRLSLSVAASSSSCLGGLLVGAPRPSVAAAVVPLPVVVALPLCLVVSSPGIGSVSASQRAFRVTPRAARPPAGRRLHRPSVGVLPPAVVES